VSEIQTEAFGTYTSDITTPEDDVIGEANLDGSEGKIAAAVQGCCLIPGNAYTRWWVIGPVKASMASSFTPLAMGFVQEGDDFDFTFEQSIDNSTQGVRLMLLDHGPRTDNPAQLVEPAGGCSGLCPIASTATFPSPLGNK